MRLHKWFALHFNVVRVLIRSDGVTDLVDDSGPNVVVPPDELALTAKVLLSERTLADCTGTGYHSSRRRRPRTQGISIGVNGGPFCTQPG